MAFIHDDFLLETPTARDLYHGVAKDLPIIDYHCHLSPEEVATDKRWDNLADIWLGGDHYKWRLMRTNGVPEALCTGDADPWDKFMAFAKTLPMALRNPMYHWCALELKRYFDIDTLLSPDTAKAIWDEANEKLKSPEMSAHGILKKFRVAVVGTTDDPVDSLEYHQKIQALNEAGTLATRVYPTFRPDKALAVDDARAFNAWCDALAKTSGQKVDSLDDLLAALKNRHDFFHSMGGRLSDHGLERCFAEPCTPEVAQGIFSKVRSGRQARPDEKEKFATFVMVYSGQLDAEKGWTKQLHVGAMRNNNTRLFKKLGADTGFDSIGDFPQGQALARYLDMLDQQDQLPKVILYNLNPSDNYLMATMVGNFQDGSVAGKIQFGSGWWFNDQLDGMTSQLNALSNLSLLGRFVGMLTDSRSFLSYPRHEYYRRLVCNLLGNDVKLGLIPDDKPLLEDYVRRLSYQNAAEHFGFALPQ